MKLRLDDALKQEVLTYLSTGTFPDPRVFIPEINDVLCLLMHIKSEAINMPELEAPLKYLLVLSLPVLENFVKKQDEFSIAARSITKEIQTEIGLDEQILLLVTLCDEEINTMELDEQQTNAVLLHILSLLESTTITFAFHSAMGMLGNRLLADYIHDLYQVQLDRLVKYYTME